MRRRRAGGGEDGETLFTAAGQRQKQGKATAGTFFFLSASVHACASEVCLCLFFFFAVPRVSEMTGTSPVRPHPPATHFLERHFLRYLQLGRRLVSNVLSVTFTISGKASTFFSSLSVPWPVSTTNVRAAGLGGRGERGDY